MSKESAEKINGAPVTEEMIQAWADEAEGGYTAYPADHPGAMEAYRRRYPDLTFFDCSLCHRPFHITAAHKDAVEAHHRKLAHAGDERAVLREQD